MNFNHILYLVRHAEGEHNIDDAHHIRDTALTTLGKEQCAQLQATFPLHDKINLVLLSPLRRATCNVGFTRRDLKDEVQKLFGEQELLFDLEKIDYSMVVEGSNSKTGFWAPHREECHKRAATLRLWLCTLPEMHVLLVTHGAFLHFLTEDWTGDGPKRGTAYLNCEVRQFRSTSVSTRKQAHIIETEEGIKLRKNKNLEIDSIILAELASVQLGSSMEGQLP
ncbi:hypothetical protein B0J14DRAFT_683324 [Halenospora varia]|nr:hypothetical protein B0J14DRAFT_683324 [Halenospora varia]